MCSPRSTRWTGRHGRLARLFVCLVNVAVLCSAGCGDDEAVTGEPATADSTADDGLTFDALHFDAGGAADVAKRTEDAAAGLEDQLATPDNGAPDVDPMSSCPGGTGCACETNGDCLVGKCIPGPDGKFCPKACVDDCPTGFKCWMYPIGPPDIALCGPLWLYTCDPCSASEQCKSFGAGDAACVDHGAAGNYCGEACDTAADCPKGYACTTVQTTEGKSGEHCVPTPAADDAGPFGPCPCTKLATSKKLTTTCNKTATDADGKTIGTCTGNRTCTADGLSDCSAAMPTAEVCNGKDDDCDGDIDEASCDDGNGCTVDACKGVDGCTHADLNGTPCDADGNICTDGDSCTKGICVPGPPKKCDDGNPCTKGGCDLAIGCTQANDDGQPCEADDNPCTVGDVCKGGGCKQGTAKVCVSDNACVAAACDVKTGKCIFTPQGAGTPCDDGSTCTDKDGCTAGACVGQAINCDDDNPCTTDGCDKTVGCTKVPNQAPCDDGSACTKADTCAGGSCIGLPLSVSADCDDNNPCTDDSCAPATGCVHSHNKLPCDADGSACTVADTCAAGKCLAGKALDCDDGNICTSDQCDKAAGCQHAINGKPCDADDNKCTVGDVCAAKVCVAGKKKVCDDGQVCTVDSCDKKSGACTWAGAPVNGLSCDADGSVCTVKDACKDGNCVPGKALDCDDGNGCRDDGCDLAKGCTHTDNNLACNADDNACTVGDGCKAGSCVAGAKKVCNDGQACTVDSCDKQSGKCGYLGKPLDGQPCDADGSVCSSKDTCAGGSCVKGKPLACDDGNSCTIDTCDAKSGCKHAASSQPCNADDNKCTVDDVCKGGSCVAGALKKCDDAKPCTLDACDTKTGICSHVAAPLEGNLCDADGTVCTPKDRCKAGVCLPDKPLSCDDNNVCTDDSCDAKAGCKHGANTKPCPDASKCTKDEVCKAGKCTTQAVVCDDGNPCTKDACDTAKGCQAPPLADQTGCGNGKWCKSGKCVLKAFCGDGKINQASEQCDDGNTADGDGCDKNCKSEAWTSCQALKKAKPGAKSGTYLIDPDGSGPGKPALTWCELEADGGGWTLVLKVDGSKKTFRYNNKVWTDNSLVAPAATALDTTEAKLPAWNTVPFTQIRLGMKVGNTTRWLVMNYAAKSMFAAMSDNKHKAINGTSRNQWLTFVNGSSLQGNCNMRGLNVAPNPAHNRARIGIVGNQEPNCGSCDSCLGIGIGGGGCGFDPAISAGNMYSGCGGNKGITGFAWVMVR